MIVIEAPNYIDIRRPCERRVFLGGGITDCPDWQADMVKMIENKLDLSSRRGFLTTLYNPRRANFNVDDPSASEVQIEWEHKHLRRADVILFWFPAETMCPITLLELGKYMVGNKPLFIGCHPDYKRKFDVEYQVKLERGDKFQVADSLDALADQTTNWLKSEFRFD